MNKEEAWKETQNKSFTEILTSMGFEKDSFMEINVKDTIMRKTDGPDFGGWDMQRAMDKQATDINGKFEVGITGSNNGVYAAYIPVSGKYVVTENPEIIQKLQKELGFQDKDLGVVFSNGDRPADPYYKSQYDKMHGECARINRNRRWEYNRETEARTFDGVEVDGFKFSFGKYSDKTYGWTNDYVGSVKTPDGKEVGITGFSGFDEENTFGKMSEEFSSKEFENKVYNDEIKKEDVMKRLDGAEKADKEFAESKRKLETAKDLAAGVQDKLNAAEKEERAASDLSKNYEKMLESLQKYAEANPKKAQKIYGYAKDIVKSAANGQTPKTPNPMKPQNFFGKMKANLFGRKPDVGEFALEDSLRQLKSAIERNPDIAKEVINKEDFTLKGAQKDFSERKTAAEKEAKICSNQYEDAKGRVDGAIYETAHSALKVAKFNKLKETVSKIFSDKEAAREIELRKISRATNGISDTENNTGVDKLAEKAKAMEELTPQQRLAMRMEQLRGTGKEEPKATVKRDINSNILNKAMENRSKGA